MARLAVICDFGIFKKPWIDQERLNFGIKQVADDFGTSVEDIKKRALRTRACLRPMSSDNIPIIGPMRHFPNVLLNVAYGSQGW